MIGWLAAGLYVLLTGDFPGAAVMGAEEDSALVVALLAVHDAVMGVGVR